MRRLTACPMPLLDDNLTIWEIGFRGTGNNPNLPWPWIPMEVKDNFRTVVRAIGGRRSFQVLYSALIFT